MIVIFKKKNENNTLYLNIFDSNKKEISFQHDSTEKNDSISYKINYSRINCLFKKNILNNKKFIELQKSRYENNLKEKNNNNQYSSTINTEKSKKFLKIKNNKIANKNYSFKKINQEIIYRTNSILCVNKNIIDKKYSSQNRDLNSINRNFWKINNNYIYKYKNSIRINKNNIQKIVILCSQIKKINLINSNNKQNITNFVSKLKDFSIIKTSSSLINNKNKIKQLFIDNNYDNIHGINHSYSILLEVIIAIE